MAGCTVIWIPNISTNLHENNQGKRNAFGNSINVYPLLDSCHVGRNRRKRRLRFQWNDIKLISNTCPNKSKITHLRHRLNIRPYTISLQIKCTVSKTAKIDQIKVKTRYQTDYIRITVWWHCFRRTFVYTLILSDPVGILTC